MTTRKRTTPKSKVTKPVQGGFLNKAQILEADDIIMKEIPIPEWGGKVNVAMMSAAQRDEFEKAMIVIKEDGTSEQNRTNFRATLCAITMRNVNGNRMFNSPGEVIELGNKSAAALERVFVVSMKLNKIGEQDVEDLTKN